MSSSAVKREWLGLEGHIQALNSNCGLSKLREPEKGDRHWFIIQDSNLMFYDQKTNQTPPDTKPTGFLNVGSSVIDVIVVISSKEGKDYQLSPPRDVCVFDWIASLKEAKRLASKQQSEVSFERGAGGGSIMGRLRNSLRRKKKVTRALSDNSKVGSNVNGTASSDTTGDHAKDPCVRQELKLKTRAQRSKSFPHEDTRTVELPQPMPPFIEQEKEPPVEQAEDAVSCDPVCEKSCEKMSVQLPAKDGDFAENKTERKRRSVATESIEVQTEPITVEELLSLQQQKLIKELEIEVCKLKCEVISLIQGSIKIPLKDDDLADWQLIEDIRYKDRIYQLLKEARLYNPSLPNCDSSTPASSSFRDSYGFIRGARESESELFHFLCRELKQHYSSFYQNRDGHARLWSQYMKARQQESKDVVFNEQGMKALLREGIPRSCRSEVWRSAMAQKVEHLKKEKGRDYYQKLLLQVERRKSLSANHPLSVTENQIKCDLLRTMPNNERFRSADSEGVKKLSRILHAFCVHRPDINYLQGMNFIVAMCLLFMNEEDAFWSFVAVSEVYLKNYFDKALSGALADQSVLNELLSESLPALHAHLKYYGVDISTVTFNWFITIFIDAVPFETAMRIWDCFVFEGREALFRIAVGLLKVQQSALLQLSCSLEIMQYMKRAARVTYDKDQLFKVSYEDLKIFPTIKTLDEKQAKYLGGVNTRLDERSISRDERTRSRVSSFTVEISNQEKLEKPDQHEILECALATSRGNVRWPEGRITRLILEDLSSPVCLFCSSRLKAKVYLLDITKKEMKALDVDTKSRVLCCDMLDDGTILVGTVSWYIHAFVLELSSEAWCIQLNDSVIDIAHLPEGKVFAALADGSIAVLQNASGQEAPSEGSHIRVGGSPVTCITLVNENVWCGCGNNVVILDGSSLGELGSLIVSNSRRHQVSKLTHGKHGVWCSVRGSSCILLLDHATFDILLKVEDVTSLDTSSDSRVIAFSESRVTTMMAIGEELWVGLGNGQVLIFDVTRNDEFEDESFVVLDEHEEDKEKRKESSTKYLPTISEKEEKIKEPEVTPSIEDSKAHSGESSSHETENTCTDEEISSIHEFTESELRESIEIAASIVDSQNMVNVQENEGQAQKPSGEQIRQDPDMYYSDYRFRLRLRVHFRINEEAIRCLLLVREQDPLVLSCTGNFNEEGALSLWQRQREEETNEWLPFSIKHRFTETAGLFLRGEDTPTN